MLYMNSLFDKKRKKIHFCVYILVMNKFDKSLSITLIIVFIVYVIYLIVYGSKDITNSKEIINSTFGAACRAFLIGTVINGVSTGLVTGAVIAIINPVIMTTFEKKKKYKKKV